MQGCYGLGLSLRYTISSYILLSRIDIPMREARKCCLAEYPGEKVKSFGAQLASSVTVHNFPNTE